MKDLSTKHLYLVDRSIHVSWHFIVCSKQSYHHRQIFTTKARIFDSPSLCQWSSLSNFSTTGPARIKKWRLPKVIYKNLITTSYPLNISKLNSEEEDYCPSNIQASSQLNLTWSYSLPVGAKPLGLYSESLVGLLYALCIPCFAASISSNFSLRHSVNEAKTSLPSESEQWWLSIWIPTYKHYVSSGLVNLARRREKSKCVAPIMVWTPCGSLVVLSINRCWQALCVFSFSFLWSARLLNVSSSHSSAPSSVSINVFSSSLNPLTTSVNVPLSSAFISWKTKVS